MKQKFLSAIAVLAAVSAVSTTVYAAQKYSAGDLRALSDSLHGTAAMTEEQDINGDGTIDVFDLISLRKALSASTGEFTETTVPATEEYTRFTGRNLVENGVTWLVHSGSAVEFIVSGRSAEVELAGDNSTTNSPDYRSRYAVLVDDEIIVDDTMGTKSKTIELFSGTASRTAKVKIIHLSEANNGATGVRSITVDSDSAVPVAPSPEKKFRIEFIGDSITCAYGVEGKDQYEGFKTTTENFMKSYAYLTAEKLDADYSAVSYSGYGIISGYTGDGRINTSSLVPPFYEYIGVNGSYRKPWDFSAKKNDIVVINLGTNDDSYCKGDETKMELYRTEYAKFLETVRKNNPDSYIICTLGTMGCTELYPYIEGAISDYQAVSGDTKITSYESAVQDMNNDGLGSDWHPSEITHRKSAAVLADRICQIMGIESDQIGIDVAQNAEYGIVKNEEAGADAATYFSDYDRSFWVNVTGGGEKSDDIYMDISGIDMKKDGKYRISCRITGDKGRKIPVSIVSADGKTVFYSNTVSIEGEKTPFTDEFTSKGTDSEARMKVEVGGKDYSSVTLYELHIEKTG